MEIIKPEMSKDSREAAITERCRAVKRLQTRAELIKAKPSNQPCSANVVRSSI